MARTIPEGTGAWNFRDLPRDLMRRVKMAAAHEGKTVKEFLIELAQARIEELERKGILPKGKG
jgi:predicted DNA-binding protein